MREYISPYDKKEKRDKMLLSLAVAILFIFIAWMGRTIYTLRYD